MKLDTQPTPADVHSFSVSEWIEDPGYPGIFSPILPGSGVPLSHPCSEPPLTWNVPRAALTFIGTGLRAVDPMVPVKQVLLLPALARLAKYHKRRATVQFPDGRSSVY